MKDVLAQQKPLVVALRSHLSLPVAVGVSAAIALSGSSLAAAYPVDEPFREGPGSDHSASHRELLFVDPFVADPEQLLIALRPNVETIILEEDRDGLEQITEALEQRRDVKAIHIVAHGEAGSLNLAGTTLTEASLSGASELLEGWFTDQPERPEILLYACDLARGPEGLAFIERLSSLAGADVAASTDLTGQGGDWELEYHLGQIATASAFNTGLIKGWSHTLATFTVTNTDDSGAGSLRQAIIDANATAGEDTITFSTSGTITLTNGQILITDDLVISGPGASALTISGNNSSRIFQVQEESSITLAISGLTLRDGYATEAANLADESLDTDGGAIHVKGDSSLTISDSVITANRAFSDGGGVSFESTGVALVQGTTFTNNTAGRDGGALDLDIPFSSGSRAGESGDEDDDDDGLDDRVSEGLSPASSGIITVRDSVFTGNTAEGDDGGALFADHLAEITILRTDFIENTADNEGGAVALDDHGIARIEDSRFEDNYAGDEGGAIYIDGDQGDGFIGSVTIVGVTVSGNTAEGDDGGGISIRDSSGTLIENTSITGNTAGEDGGGLFFDEPYAAGPGSGELIIRNSEITDNISGEDGGGVALDGSANSEVTAASVTIENSAITRNVAYDDGGGIYAKGTSYFFEENAEVIRSDISVTIADTEISENVAGENGGAIAASGFSESDAAVYVTDSVITNNQADAGDDEGRGGGISATTFYGEVTLQISHSTIAYNSSGYEGGGVSVYSGTVDAAIDHSTLSGNYALDDGGGLIVYAENGGTVAIVNSTFFGNSTGGGGGAIKVELFDESTIDIQHTTISHNTAQEHAGGIGAEDGDVSITDSIVANNTSGEGYAPDIYAYTGNVDSTYSLIGDTTDSSVTDLGGSLLDVDAGLADELEDLGGPTKVLSLLATSPAIDAGRPSGDFPEFEQRGGTSRGVTSRAKYRRIVNSRVDMGAVEADRDGDGIPDSKDPLPNDPTNGVGIPTAPSWILMLLGSAMGWLGIRSKRLGRRTKRK